MNRKGQTTSQGKQLPKRACPVIGDDVFDYILVNNRIPPNELIQMYAEEED